MRVVTVFKSIEVAGDAYQIGRGLGEAAARAFHETVTKVERYEILKRDWSGSERLKALVVKSLVPEHLTLHMKVSSPAR